MFISLQIQIPSPSNLMSSLPKIYRKLSVSKLTPNFREATKITEHEINFANFKNQQNAIIKPKYVGINASDINFTSGKYYPGKKPPFPVGFEAVGEVVHLEKSNQNSKKSLSIGQPVAYCFDGAFSELHEVPISRCYPIKNLDPEYAALLVSGMTAKLALDELGEMEKFKDKNRQNILVTASAGGTGHLFAQLAKMANNNPDKNFVMGTTSSPEKANWLLNQKIVDHAINIREVSIKNELKNLKLQEKLDLCYESVGKELFDDCFLNLNLKGRLITLGYIEGYKDKNLKSSINISKFGANIPVRLLMKSASVRGFFLFHWADQWERAFTELCEMYEDGSLNVCIDGGYNVEQEDSKVIKFQGLEQVADAVDYLYTRKSVGKIIAEL